MVQEMNILRCYSCHIFQVHIVKKANKWQCKICNEKQSVQHVYYQGSGQDCRLQVQSLNYKKHMEEQQKLEALEKTEVVEKKHDVMSVIEKPAITQSRWTKYMVPESENYETVSIDIRNNTSNGTNTFQDNFTADKTSFNGKFMDRKETEHSFSSINNLSQTFANRNHDVEDVSIFANSFQSSNTLHYDSKDTRDRKEDVSLVKNHRLPSITNSNASRKLKLEPINGEEQSSASGYGDDSSKNKQNIVIIRKHVKRNTNGENVLPESQSTSLLFDREPLGIICKRSKFVDASSCRKKSLRDIVELNRSNAGRIIDFEIKEKNSVVPNSELVLKEMNNSSRINLIETEIVKADVKKRTIFETDCDDLEDILDF